MATLNMDRILQACVSQGASDIHLTVGRPPVLRIDGGLRSLETKVLDPDDTSALMRSITPDRCQQELQEEGGTDFGFAFGDACRFRVAVFKQKGTVAVVLRQIPNSIMTFEQIGLPKICAALCRRPRGLFLVTGPTGSGKTTTLACMINYINENLSLVDAVFRVFLARGNKPLTCRELGSITGRLPETILRTLSGRRVYKGIRPVY